MSADLSFPEPTILTKDDIEKLAAPFPEGVLRVKVQALSKEKDRALVVTYLQHTDVAARLDEVDPAWSFSIVRCRRMAIWDSVKKVDVGRYYASGTLTIKGVSRDNVGEGDDPKEAYSDSLKRCAMSFGVGRWLYNQGQLWIPHDPKKDRYRTYTLEEARALAGKKAAPRPAAQGKPAANGNSGQQAAPPQSSEPPTEKKLSDMLMFMAGGDLNVAKDLIERFSKFTGNDGKEKSIRSVKELAEKKNSSWLNTTYGRAQKAFAEWQEALKKDESLKGVPFIELPASVLSTGAGEKPEIDTAANPDDPPFVPEDSIPF